MFSMQFVTAMNQLRRPCALMLFAVMSLAAGNCKLQAGQEMIVPIRYLVERSHLIAEVNVTNVTQVDVPTGKGQLTSIYVAEATIVQTIKPDREPMPVNSRLAIVGSTLPRTSAVFKPIQEGRYLAFLQAEQGHYHYGMNMALRPVDAEGNVYWYEYKDGRAADFSQVPLKKAIERIQEVQRELAAEREANTRGAIDGSEIAGKALASDEKPAAKDTAGRENRDAPSVAPQTPATPAAADDTPTEKPASRKLRDFELSHPAQGDTSDPVLSMYDHLWVEVTDDAKIEAVKKELAKYGRVVKGYAFRVWGADVYDDVDTAAARAALAKLDGVGETGTHKRGAYDKRIPDLKATLEIGKRTYSVGQADGLDLTFVLTNTSEREPREFRSVDSSMCQLDLTLAGPGAQSDEIVNKTHVSSRVLLGKVIRLEPGKSYQIPMTNLKYGGEYLLHQWKWTKPGEYTLTAAYVIGEVRYEAPPVKLTVVDK